MLFTKIIVLQRMVGLILRFSYDSMHLKRFGKNGTNFNSFPFLGIIRKILMPNYLPYPLKAEQYLL
jgi:hypothetical protein